MAWREYCVLTLLLADSYVFFSKFWHSVIMTSMSSSGSPVDMASALLTNTQRMKETKSDVRSTHHSISDNCSAGLGSRRWWEHIVLVLLSVWWTLTASGHGGHGPSVWRLYALTSSCLLQREGGLWWSHSWEKHNDRRDIERGGRNNEEHIIIMISCNNILLHMCNYKDGKMTYSV